MIDWVAIKEATESLVADLTGLGSDRVRWQEEAGGATWTRDPVIYLIISSPREIGFGEERREDPTDEAGDLTGDNQIVVAVAQKLFTLTLRCESFCQDISDPRHAGSILGTFETRLIRSTTAERLNGILTVTDATTPRPIGYVDEDRRQVSAYVMDLFCATVDNDVDDSAGAGGFIDEIEIAGTVQDGAVLRPVNIDVKG